MNTYKVAIELPNDLQEIKQLGENEFRNYFYSKSTNKLYYKTTNKLLLTIEPTFWNNLIELESIDGKKSYFPTYNL